MSTYIDQFRRDGLTNHDSEDFGTVASRKRQSQYRNYCTSTKCAPTNKESNIKKKFKFTSRKLIMDCVDCGSALFSEREYV